MPATPASGLPPSTELLTLAGIAVVFLVAIVVFRLPPGFIVIFAAYVLSQLFRRPGLMRELGRRVARATRAR